MKTTEYYKKTILLGIFALATVLVASCDNNQNQQTDDSKEVAKERNEERFDDNNDREEDSRFLVNAAEMNLEEIHMGKLAQQKGSTEQVRQLGKKMEDAHTKSLNELKSLASSKKMSIPNSPTDDTKDAYNDLNEKSGEDFDEAYMDRTVNGHQDAIDAYEDAATDSNDMEIKNWASTALPGLRNHLNHSKDIQKKFADMHLEKSN